MNTTNVTQASGYAFRPKKKSFSVCRRIFTFL